MIVNDDIEDSAELFVVKFLYNLLIYTFFLRKMPMISTWSWLDRHKIVPDVVRNQTIAAFNNVEQNGD
jgi:hypothetical protein